MATLQWHLQFCLSGLKLRMKLLMAGKSSVLAVSRLHCAASGWGVYRGVEVVIVGGSPSKSFLESWLIEGRTYDSNNDLRPSAAELAGRLNARRRIGLRDQDILKTRSRRHRRKLRMQSMGIRHVQCETSAQALPHRSLRMGRMIHQNHKTVALCIAS